MKTTEEMIAVMQAYAAGKKIEFRCQSNGTEWNDNIDPSWDWRSFDYRIAVTKPSIDCSHVHKDFNWMVRGSCRVDYWITDAAPIKQKDYWITHPGSKAVSATSFASFKPGTCGWQDSLVERPR